MKGKRTTDPRWPDCQQLAAKLLIHSATVFWLGKEDTKAPVPYSTQRESFFDFHEYEFIEKGDLVMLRTLVETDIHHYKRWQTQGEWRLLDAPWAQNVTEEKKDKESRKKQTNIQDDSVPQKRAVIATIENKPLGWVNRCVGKNSQLVWVVGIDICEDDYLNCGYGTEALKLWVKHLLLTLNIIYKEDVDGSRLLLTYKFKTANWRFFLTLIPIHVVMVSVFVMLFGAKPCSS